MTTLRVPPGSPQAPDIQALFTTTRHKTTHRGEPVVLRRTVSSACRASHHGSYPRTRPHGARFGRPPGRAPRPAHPTRLRRLQVGAGDQLDGMAGRVLEVHAPAAVFVVDLARAPHPGIGPVL